MLSDIAGSRKAKRKILVSGETGVMWTREKRRVGTHSISVMAAGRLVRSFCVYGVREEEPMMVEQGEDATNFSDGLNSLGSLRLLLLPTSSPPVPPSELIDYLPLCPSGPQTLWLELSYGRRGAYMHPAWTPQSPSIYWVSFYYLAVENGLISVPVDLDYIPVPLVASAATCPPTEVAPFAGTRRYAGKYDLGRLVAGKEVSGHQLTMVYKASRTELPIAEMRVVNTCAVQKPDGKVKRVVVLPEGYEQINYLIGSSHNILLCFKRQRSPWSLSFQPSLIQRFPPDKENEPLAKSRAIFCFPSGLRLTTEEQPITTCSYVVTATLGNGRNESDGRLYVTCVTFSETLCASLRAYLRPPASLPLFSPKCLCLTSYFPFLDQFTELLKHALQLSMSTAGYPLERFIANITRDIPVPDRGKTLVQYNLPSKVLSFARPAARGIPEISEKSLRTLFYSLKLDTIVQVWSALLLERKVILHSSVRSSLTPVALALISLLFPYKWEHVLIPVLPDQLSAFVETIFPYIIGTSSAASISTVPADAIIVLLDTGNLISKEPIAQLPSKICKRLTARLNNWARYYHSGPPLSDELVPSMLTDMREETGCVEAEAVQDAFLEAQCELIRDYDQFFHIPSPGSELAQSSMSFINIPEYVRVRKLKKEDFLYQVLHTTLFTRFIEGRCFSPDSNLEISYFDWYYQFSALRHKWSSKSFPFVNFAPPNKVYICPPPITEDLAPGEEVRYDRFPVLRMEMWPEERGLPNLETQVEAGETLEEAEEVRVQGLGDTDWAKLMLAAIYSLWLTFACFSLQASLRPFAPSLMSLCASVLTISKKSKLPIYLPAFDRLLEACGHCQLKPLAIKLLKSRLYAGMRSLGAHPDAYYYGIYIQAAAEAKAYIQTRENQTFDRFPSVSDAILSISDLCPACGRAVNEDDFLSFLEKSVTVSRVACVCSSYFQPRLTVTQIDSAADELTVPVLSPLELWSRVSHGDTVFPAVLSDTGLYWSLGFYFSLVQLPTYVLEQTANEAQVRLSIENHSEKHSKLARLADAFSWKAKTVSLFDPEASPSDHSQSSTQRTDSSSQKSVSTESPTKSNAVKSLFSRFFTEFHRETALKRLKVRETAPMGTSGDVGTEPSDVIPPMLPAVHNKFLGV